MIAFIFLGNDIQKKWKNLRLSYVRDIKRSREVKSGSAATDKAKYIYSDLLSFLSPVIQHKM